MKKAISKNKVFTEENLLQAAYKASVILQSAEYDDDIYPYVLKGMETIAKAIKVDRINIYKNETEDGVLFYIHLVQWIKGKTVGKPPLPRPLKYPAGLKRKFSANMPINGPVSRLSQTDKNIVFSKGIKSILGIPLFLKNALYGFITFEDFALERSFKQEEIDILGSAGILFAGAMNRQITITKIKSINKRTQVLLNAIPLSTHLWDKDCNLIDCNEENTKLFNLKEKGDFTRKFKDLAPPFQPDGEPSSNALQYVRKAFRDGEYVSEWMHQTLDGEPLPVEVTLKRVNFDNEDYVASYVHDLREHKRLEEEIKTAHKRTKIFLDALPFAAQLWDKNLNLIDCNTETLNILGLKNKKKIINNFFDFSPQYQPDGQLSSISGKYYLAMTLKKGKCITEWMWKFPDGKPLPIEVTLVRINIEDEVFIATYARDLREYKTMMEGIEQRDYLLSIVNKAAGNLLQSEPVKFNNILHRCMGMLANALNIDHIYIWKNYTKQGGLFCKQMHEWTSEKAKPLVNYPSVLSYNDFAKSWRKALSSGNYINAKKSSMSKEEQENLARLGIKSMFLLPVFWMEQFWGFVGFDDCQKERNFTENEISIMCSGGIVFSNALLRNEIMQNEHNTAAKLEAVIANYPGIIWSIDLNNTITLFNGRYLDKYKYKPKWFEGKKPEEINQDNVFIKILLNLGNNLFKKAYDFNTEIYGCAFRVRTTLIKNETGKVTSVTGSFDDISERIKLQADLEVALKEAQRANQAKSSFLTNMSHEMRTPLNAIIGLSELSLTPENIYGETQSNLEKINSAGTTLLSTVNDILDISKIEAGKLDLIPVVYDIPSLLNDAITQSIQHAGDKPIKFILNINEKLPTKLFGDDLRIKQVLNNLLSNAFKYTKKGSVELEVICTEGNTHKNKKEGDDVWFTARVRDTGIGIKAKYFNEIFSNYSQMDTMSNRKVEGTGLGLSIAKRIVEMMDGSISVESKYGKGSVFTVKLRQQFVTTATIGPEIVESLKTLRYSVHKRYQNSRIVRIKLPYARVLVVDDVPTNLDVTRGMMKPYGMQIDCVRSGKEAIKAIKDQKVKYNAIFMDHMMPEMDGIEATRIIREKIGTAYAKKIPIIALTANAIVGNEDFFLKNGFQAFISKPIEIEKLDTVIREWVRNKKLEEKIKKEETDRSSIDKQNKTDIKLPEIKLEGINIERSLQRFSGDMELLIHVLRSFIDNTRPLLKQIETVDKNNLGSYSIIVHGIKGSSRGIGADALGSRAEALEKAAKENNYGFVSNNNEAFIKEAEKLIKELDNMLKQINSTSQKPKRNKIEKGLILKLLKACEVYDMDGVDCAMEELEKYEYTQDKELSVWLKENVDKMNFTQIKEKLSAYIK